MDRIREAVTRARGNNTMLGGRGSAVKQVLETRAHFYHEPSAENDAFALVHCDFDHFGRHRIISNEQDPVLAAYRVLRTRVLQKMEAEGWKTLGVVAPNSGAGKTVTAINLAIAIGSKRGSRAVLVDLDFYRPSIAKYLGVPGIPSVLDYFEGSKALREVTVKPDLPDVLLIGNERVSHRGAEHLSSPRADELISRCINEYAARAVIFDLSPLLGCDDSIALLPKLDCVLMIAASGSTKIGELAEARRLLGDAHVVGSLLNKAPAGASANYNYY